MDRPADVFMHLCYYSSYRPAVTVDWKLLTASLAAHAPVLLQ
jgi:hypothetical protein